jgi:hypothetical protein
MVSESLKDSMGHLLLGFRYQPPTLYIHAHQVFAIGQLQSFFVLGAVVSGLRPHLDKQTN